MNNKSSLEFTFTLTIELYFLDSLSLIMSDAGKKKVFWSLSIGPDSSLGAGHPFWSKWPQRTFCAFTSLPLSLESSGSLLSLLQRLWLNRGHSEGLVRGLSAPPELAHHSLANMYNINQKSPSPRVHLSV